MIECVYNGTHPGSIDADGNLIEVDVLKLGPDYPTANQDLPLHIAASPLEAAVELVFDLLHVRQPVVGGFFCFVGSVGALIVGAAVGAAEGRPVGAADDDTVKPPAKTK